MKYLLLPVAVFLLVPQAVLAHCPLCTAGAGALAVAASFLGVSTVVVGILIGAFSIALSLWVTRMVKKQYIPYQDVVLALAVFFSTIIPIMPLIREYRALYISMAGEYGTLLHNTYTVNLYLLGAAVGAVVICLAPILSRVVTRYRGGVTIPFQGMVLTFSLLLVVSVLFQFLF